MRRGGEEANVGRMSAIDVRMGDAGEDAEVLAMILQELEIGRGT